MRRRDRVPQIDLREQEPGEEPDDPGGVQFHFEAVVGPRRDLHLLLAHDLCLEPEDGARARDEIEVALLVRRLG